VYCCTFFDSWICGFVALGLVFPCQATRLAWGTSLKWPILCRVGRKTTTQSINQSVSTYFRPLRQIRSCSNHQTVTRMNWFKLYTLHVTRKSPKTDRCCDGWSECSLFWTSPGCGSHQHTGNTVRWRNPGRSSRDGLHGLVCDRHTVTDSPVSPAVAPSRPLSISDVNAAVVLHSVAARRHRRLDQSCLCCSRWRKVSRVGCCTQRFLPLDAPSWAQTFGNIWGSLSISRAHMCNEKTGNEWRKNFYILTGDRLYINVSCAAIMPCAVKI